MPAPVAGILFLLATLLLAARHLTGGRADLSHGVCGASATFVPKRPCAACGRNFMNVVEPILFQAKHNPPAPAMCAPGTALGIVSYARLARFIHSVGHRAVRLGVAPGQIVAIHVSDHIFHAAIALGFMHLGIVTVTIGAN